MSFDRAAACYDRTRITDPGALTETLDLLERQLGGRGRALEIGVGTGALAVPLAERGLDVLGIDLSPAMLERLRTKSATLPVAAADATALPFADGAFGGAFARWVLHLVPAWRDAVAELCRVVEPGGVVVLEPGGYRGHWLEVWQRIETELGAAVRLVGLDVTRDGYGELDAAFAAHGAEPRDAVTIVDVHTSKSMEDFFREARERSFSWTWRVEPDDLRSAIDEVEAWAHERYGSDLDAVGSDLQMVWRTYDLP